MSARRVTSVGSGASDAFARSGASGAFARSAASACAWLALGASLVGCAAPAWPGGSRDPAERDIAALHARKCGACHSAPDPKTRTRGYLEDALSRHRKRVHLTSEEWAEMTDYLAMPEGKTARQP